jgi:hypothetical protein
MGIAIWHEVKPEAGIQRAVHRRGAGASGWVEEAVNTAAIVLEFSVKLHYRTSYQLLLGIAAAFS